MFKIRESDLATSYRLIKDNPYKDMIKPGTVLVIDGLGNGVRIAGGNEDLTVENSRQWLISCDHYSNTGMARIDGMPDSSEEFITAVPLYEKYNLTIDMPYPAKVGDEFSIQGGRIRPASKGDIVAFRVVKPTGYNVTQKRETELTTVMTYHEREEPHYGDLTIIHMLSDHAHVLPTEDETEALFAIHLRYGNFKDGEADDVNNWRFGIRGESDKFGEEVEGFTATIEKTISYTLDSDVAGIVVKITGTGANDKFKDDDEIIIEMVGENVIERAFYDVTPLKIDIIPKDTP